jgi:hypothetical protein
MPFEQEIDDDAKQMANQSWRGDMIRNVKYKKESKRLKQQHLTKEAEVKRLANESTRREEGD